MFRKIACDCDERVGTEINSIKMLDDINDWLAENLEEGIFKTVKVSKAYYIGKSMAQTLKWYADKWCKCRSCGTFWEIIYPDFPANGRVRKFTKGEQYVDINEKTL